MTSPFASKLGTNYCPLDDEVPEIRALLVEPLSRLKRIDDQIADLQKAIDELAQERESVRAFVDSHNELISPFRRLPLDIIQEIFVACLPTHRNCVMSAVEAPTLLGRICSSWRGISLTTPRLWSRLHIVELSRLGVADAVFEEKLAQRVETTKAWLGRSGKCPLSISFQGCPDIPVPPGAISNDVFVSNTSHLFMQAIIPFTPRWQSITLCASSVVLETLSSITEDDVPLLQKLMISQHFGTGFTLPLPTFALLRAPRLIDFTFGGGHANIRNLPIQWENLTHLSLTSYNDSLTCPIALQLLVRCSQLQLCSFNFSQQDTLSLVDGAGRTIELPFLHSLYISSVGLPVNGIGNMLRRLSLIGLRHLHLRGELDIGLENLFVANLLAFLGVSLCFESLKIDTANSTTSSLTELLLGLPSSTTRLHIGGTLSWRLAHANGILNVILYDDVITVLTPTPQNPGSCPALQELHIARCMSLSDEALLRFIKARMTAVHPTLRKVVIKFSREMQVDIAQDIQPLSDDGRLEVITTYAQPPQPRAVGSFSPWHGLPDAPELADWAPMDDF